MKRMSNPVLPRPQEEPVINWKPCCICHKLITRGYYGAWAEGGTCSKTCELAKERENEVLHDMQL